MFNSHFQRRSGLRRGGLALGLLALAALPGCIYSFVQGGLPPHIRSVAILPFENRTVESVLATEVQQLLQNRLPRDLGVRLAPPATADALIRGTIIAIEEPPPVARPTGANDGVEVLQREVRIVAEAEIYDVRQNRPLYGNRALTAIGRYRPETQSSTAARAQALEDLARLIAQGAQSQW